MFDDRHANNKILNSIILLAPDLKMADEDSFDMLRMGLNEDFIQEACNWKCEEQEEISPPRKPLSAFHVFNIANSLNSTK